MTTPDDRPPVVLVAEDHPGIRALLGTAFRTWGVAAHLAADGAEAVALFRLHRADISLVLLDVCMPWVDGPHTLDVIRATDPDVRCWFMTGSPAPYTYADLLARGAEGVFPKPFPLDHLRAVVGGRRPALAGSPG